jgi:hypothetical protein
VTGFWLLSYLALWGLVALLALLLVGVLRQLGALHLRLAALSQSPAGQSDQSEVLPPLEQDGPPLGAPLPDWARTVTEEARDTEEDWSGRRSILLMFLSPMCETCQHVVDPLNEVAVDPTYDTRPIAVIRADRPAYEAFLNVFPLHLPTLRDSDQTLTMELGVHRAPFGLLYDQEGALVRKGLIEGRDDLLALLAEAPGAEANAHIVRGLALAAR